MNYLTLRIKFILIGIIFILNFANASCSFIKHNDTILIASRGSRVINFNLGTDVLIRYDNESKKINGKIIKVSSDSVLISTKNKAKSTVSVAVDKIDSVMKLHKNGRRGWIPSLSLLVLLTIFGLILLSKNSFLTLIVLGIPVVSLYTYLPFLTINFLSDLFSKKSIKKGWIFSSKSNLHD